MDYTAHLSKDKRFKKLIEQQEVYKLKQRKNVCFRLCGSIMSQQLSTKVAQVIYKRFLDLFSGAEPSPEQILDIPFDTLRAIGLSNAKTNYVQNVARFAVEHGMDNRKLNKLSNEEIIEQF